MAIRESTSLAASLRKRVTLRTRVEGIYTFACFLAGLLSVVTTAVIIYVLFDGALHFFRQVSPREFFTGTRWQPTFAEPSYGVLPLVTGTALIAIGSAVIAIPIGLLISIYLSEYAHPKVRSIVKPALEILAGVPTVVYGFLGLTFITPLLKQIGIPVDTFNALSGAIVVGIMIIPLVTSLSEDAISAVPSATREAAYGLGASKAEVSTTVVLRAASSGIIASFILAISRAIGETMAVSLAAGARPSMTLNPADQIQTMTAAITGTIKGDAVVGSPAYNSLFAVGLTLFVTTFFLNVLSMRLVKKLKRHHG